MSGGGQSGDVRFPPYIEDVHAYLYAGVAVDSGGGGRFELPTWDKPTKSVVDLLTTLWGTNPYASFGWTDPATALGEAESQFDLFYANVTAFGYTNYTSYILQAIKAIGNTTTVVPIADLTYALSTAGLSSPQTLIPSYGGVGRTLAFDALSGMIAAVQPDVQALIPDAASVARAATTITAGTTLWLSLLTTVSTKLAQCNIPKNANLLSVLTKASQDAETNLDYALRIAKSFIEDGLLADVVEAFQGRREITFARQSRQFAGQMADINAINSTGFLFGMAILKAEQMREVAEFDSNLSLNQFNQGIATYVKIHADTLTAGLAVEQQNAQAHNRLLEASTQLISQLAIRGEIFPSDLIRLYGQFFATELGMYDANARAGLTQGGSLFSVLSGNQLERDSQLARFNLEAARVNKVAEEQRYLTGLQQIQGMLANRIQFEQLAANLKTEQKRIEIVATQEYDTIVNDTEVEEDLWDIKVARHAADIMVAPAGMSAAIPNKPSAAASALGGALQGAAGGASVGSAIPGVGTAIGAGVGALVGGIGGLLQ